MKNRTVYAEHDENTKYAADSVTVKDCAYIVRHLDFGKGVRGLPPLVRIHAKVEECARRGKNGMWFRVIRLTVLNKDTRVLWQADEMRHGRPVLIGHERNQKFFRRLETLRDDLRKIAGPRGEITIYEYYNSESDYMPVANDRHVADWIRDTVSGWKEEDD